MNCKDKEKTKNPELTCCSNTCTRRVLASMVLEGEPSDSLCLPLPGCG